jgi:hypothetical protein
MVDPWGREEFWEIECFVCGKGCGSELDLPTGWKWIRMNIRGKQNTMAHCPDCLKLPEDQRLEVMYARGEVEFGFCIGRHWSYGKGSEVVN